MFHYLCMFFTLWIILCWFAHFSMHMCEMLFAMSKVKSILRKKKQAVRQAGSMEQLDMCIYTHCVYIVIAIVRHNWFHNAQNISVGDCAHDEIRRSYDFPSCLTLSLFLSLPFPSFSGLLKCVQHFRFTDTWFFEMGFGLVAQHIERESTRNSVPKVHQMMSGKWAYTYTRQSSFPFHFFCCCCCGLTTMFMLQMRCMRSDASSLLNAHTI